MVQQVLHRPEQLSEPDFLALGLQHIAYIRPAKTDRGTPVFGVFAANGQQMGVVETADLAVAAIKQQDLEPVWVH